MSLGSAIYILFSLAVSTSAHAQADTGPAFVDFEHLGAARTVFEADCGGSEYRVEETGEGWTFRKGGERVSEEVDTFLSRALAYFDYAVQLKALDCGDFGGPGVTEGLNFRVVKRFDLPEGPVLQIGTYGVWISEDRVTGHSFTSMTRPGEPPARGVANIRLFLEQQGFEDAPGVIEAERLEQLRSGLNRSDP